MFAMAHKMFAELACTSFLRFYSYVHGRFINAKIPKLQSTQKALQLG